MAADVRIVRLTGVGPGTETDITNSNTRLATDDNANPGDSYPIPIPAASVKRSFWCVTRLKAATTPAGTINNIQWYTDGVNSLGTGVTAFAGNSANYVRATGTIGDTGDELNPTNYSGLNSKTDMFSYTTGSPMSVAGSISNPSTLQFGNYVVLSIEVGSTAVAGVTPTETMTFRYDET
jgi:hypothetical protein